MFNYCSQCGKKLLKDAKFCAYCGVQVDSFSKCNSNLNSTFKANSLEILYKTGLKYFVEENYDKAINLYKQAAIQGDAEGQFELGYAYFHGLGVSQDYNEAAYWYKKSAAQGYDLAQFELGLFESVVANK